MGVTFNNTSLGVLPEEPEEEEEDWDNLEEDKPTSDTKDSSSNQDWEKQALDTFNKKMASTQVRKLYILS